MLENGRRTRHFLSYILDTVNIYISILINHRFYIDAEDSYGCTLLHRCIYNYKKSESESYNELIKILLNNGSDVDKKIRTETHRLSYYVNTISTTRNCLRYV